MFKYTNTLGVLKNIKSCVDKKKAQEESCASGWYDQKQTDEKKLL
jgi:hypothetical protein